MIPSDKSRALLESPGNSTAEQFSVLLRAFYADLIEQGIPEDMAKLVHQIERGRPRPGADGRRIALVVERDAQVRHLAVEMLKETGLAVLECTSAEAALTILKARGADVSFVFADQKLAGARDGIALAKAVGTLWPQVRVVVTIDDSDRPAGLPADVVSMQKPWRGLDVIVQAGIALRP